MPRQGKPWTLSGPRRVPPQVDIHKPSAARVYDAILGGKDNFPWDRAVAAEAACALVVMGNTIARVDDVGVAGLHRVLGHVGALRTANAIVAVAGMDGALPGVIAGLTDRPVIAVPTSVGYGASFGGLAALLTMLNACAGGVCVVNIDGGFNAACAASRINHLAVKARSVT